MSLQIDPDTPQPPAHADPGSGSIPAHRHAHAPGHGWAGDDERIVPGTRLWERQLGEHLQRYELAASQMRAGARVLDAGCGVGYGAAHLADRGASAVVAVDLDDSALTIARAQFHRDAIRWIREDCQELAEAGAAGPFDLIVNLENIEHLPDPHRFLDRVVDLLAPSGTFVVSTPNRIAMDRAHGSEPDSPSSNPHHHVEFSAAEFKTLLGAWFDRVDLVFQTLDPPERQRYEPVLLLMWQNPFMRLGRALQRLLRGRRIAARLDDLLPPPRYRISPTEPPDDLAITLLAVCSGPRKPRA